jgi:mono/diheme cytochrome c family protein
LKVACLLLCLTLCACRRAMVDQPRLRPLAEDNFFANGAGSRALPAHTVARGHLDEDDAFFTGKLNGQLVIEIPARVTRELLSRGRERFEIHCAVCHARIGDGNGIVVQRGFPRPPSLHEQRLRDAPIGHFFDVMTNGYGVMYAYAGRVEPADRWAIAAYIRALQLSQHAMRLDVSAEEGAKLDAMQK